AAHKGLLTVGVAALSVSIAVGQFPGGGFGGFGGQGGADPVALLRNPSVKKELKVSEEQMKKLPDALWKALGEILDADQAKRLRQIQLQQRGVQAFQDPKVQADLKLTDEQKESIKSAIEKSNEEIKELFAGGFDAENFQKMQTIRKETLEKVTGMLKTEQKRAWSDMVGEEFKMEFGFGKGKGFKGK